MAVHRIDPSFSRELKRFGAFDIAACFNCGSCTAVCQHSEETASFPRRLIRYGQLGMRDRLLASKEIWLCWNCRDCSDSCPRQARPSEFLEASRRYAIAGMDPSGISRLMYSSTLFLAGFSLLLAALFAGVLLSRAETPSSGALDLFGFIPFELIHDLGIVVMALLGLLALVNLVRLVGKLSKSMGAGIAGQETGQPVEGLLSRIVGATRDVLDEIARQRRFRSCEVGAEKPMVLRPWFVHYTIMWGFIGLGVATALDFLFKTPGLWVPLWYPTRLMGTVAGLALMYGTTITIYRWMRPDPRLETRRLPSDWLFLGLLFLVGLTGFLLEALVYMPQNSAAGYALFLVHVVLAMELLVLLPFTKFVHALYRPLAYWLYRFKTARAESLTAELSTAD